MALASPTVEMQSDSRAALRLPQLHCRRCDPLVRVRWVCPLAWLFERLRSCRLAWLRRYREGAIVSPRRPGAASRRSTPRWMRRWIAAGVRALRLRPMLQVTLRCHAKHLFCALNRVLRACFLLSYHAWPLTSCSPAHLTSHAQCMSGMRFNNC